MEACKHLPDLVLQLDGNVDDIYKLLKIVKPEWKKQEIQIKVLSGGCACYMYRCSSDNDVKGSVTVRATGLLEGLSDSILERQVLKVMSANGCFSPILALFKNGYCYEYVEGIQFCHSGMTRLDVEEDILRLVAQRMASIHSAKVPDVDYGQTNFFDFVRGVIESSEQWFDGCPNVNVWVQEWEFITEVATAVKSPLVLMHGDPHVNNIIFNKENQKVTFVDWELCRVGPQAADIAYFLYSIEYFTFLYQIPHTKPNDYELLFCKHYLQRYTDTKCYVASLDQLFHELKHYRLVVLLLWLIYMVRFEGIIEEKFGVGFEKAYAFVLGLYLTSKREILGIGSFGRSADEIRIKTKKN